MKPSTFKLSAGQSITRSEANDDGGASSHMAADEELIEDEGAVDEQDLTDTIAGQQWEKAVLFPMTDFLGQF